MREIRRFAHAEIGFEAEGCVGGGVVGEEWANWLCPRGPRRDGEEWIAGT